MCFDFLYEIKIAGVPADVIAHIVLGALIFGFFRLARFSLVFAALLVIAFAVQKELLDFANLAGNGSFFEAMKDIGFSICGGVSGMLTVRAGRGATQGLEAVAATFDSRATPLVITDRRSQQRAKAILAHLSQAR